MSSIRDTADRRKKAASVAPSDFESPGVKGGDLDVHGRPPPPYQKSLFIAYVCWMFGWWFGAHHWYLERHSQAFLWMTSCGGFCVGAFFDFFMLPKYVREANGGWDPYNTGIGIRAYFLYLTYAQFFTSMFSGPGIMFGRAVGLALAIPALQFGRRTFGVPSRSTKLVLMAGFSVLQLESVNPESGIAFIRSVVGLMQKNLPDKEHTVGRHSLWKRFSFFVMVLMGMFVGATLIEITTTDGRKATLASQFTKLGSQAYQMLHNVYNMGFQDFVTTMRSLNEEDKALLALDLKEGATLKEIKAQYKVMANLHHPDKGGSVEKMQEINAAFKTLKNVCPLRNTLHVGIFYLVVTVSLLLCLSTFIVHLARVALVDTCHHKDHVAYIESDYHTPPPSHSCTVSREPRCMTTDRFEASSGRVETSFAFLLMVRLGHPGLQN